MKTTLEQLVNNIDYEPAYITLWLSSTKKITGLAIGVRVDKTQGTLGKYIYDIRHIDGGDDLMTLEKNVLVNWGTSIALDEPIEELESKEYLDIVDWGFESWIEVAEGALNGMGSHDDIDEFITDHWENLAPLEHNLNNFLDWIKER